MAKDYCGSASQRSGSVHYGQIWLGAMLEAQSWKVRDESKRIAAFEAKWECDERIDRSENSRCCGIWFQRAISCAGDAEILFGSSNVLRQSLQQTKAAGCASAGDLPQVDIDERTVLPRAYAAVASYLEAVDYEFDEQTFEQYFTAIQETVAFEMARTVATASLRASWCCWSRWPRFGGTAGHRDAPLPSSNPIAADRRKPQPAEYFGAPSLATLIASMRRIDGAGLERTVRARERSRANSAARSLRRLRAHGFREPRQLPQNDRATGEAIGSDGTGSGAQDRGIGASDPCFSAMCACGNVNPTSATTWWATAERCWNKRLDIVRRSQSGTQRLIKRWPDFSYILGIELVTLALMATVVLGGKSKLPAGWSWPLFLLPAAECAVALVNQLATTLFPPKASAQARFLPRAFPRNSQPWLSFRRC